MQWEVIGHEKQKELFARSLRSGEFLHAYLFTGPAMIGKQAFALELIRAAHGGAVAGVSDRYAVIVGSSGQGTIEIEGSIRPLRAALALRPPPGVRTFVLMDDAERMSAPSANALLKLLEEPPDHVTFLLVSAQPGRLPDTVRSRCREVKFHVAGSRSVREFLSEREMSPKDRDALVVLSAGRIGWLKRVIDAGEVSRVRASAEELDRRLEQGIAERLAWAKELSDREDRRELVMRWLSVARPRMASEPALAGRMHGLLELYDILGQSQFNARLAIEDFLLSV